MALEWLMAKAAPVIRYRTQIELINECDKGLLDDILSDILALPQTQKRLSLLRNLDYNRVHGSDSTYLENVLPMLSDYGLHYSVNAFQHETNCILEITEGFLKYHYYDKIIAAPFLLRSKFPIDGLLDFTRERIETVYDFTRHMNFDIYDDVSDYSGVPRPFQNRPVIKPSIACGDMCRLPLIYDIVMLAEVYNSVSNEMQEKIDNIINYVISPGYDAILEGYGILYTPPRKYYSMGWDCKKPFNDNQDYGYPNLHRLLLYSCFPSVVKTKWFQNSIGFLTQFKTSCGTYSYPREYLIEKNSNWVLGAHMSLAENRRKSDYSEIESTFYMLKLLSCLQ